MLQQLFRKLFANNTPALLRSEKSCWKKGSSVTGRSHIPCEFLGLPLQPARATKTTMNSHIRNTQFLWGPRHQNYYEFSHPKHAILVGMEPDSYRSYRNPNQRVCRILHETGSKNSKPRLVGVFAKLESEAFTNRACQDKDFDVEM